MAEITAVIEGSEIKRDLGNVKSVADKVTMWEQRGIGALAMSGFAASSLTLPARAFSACAKYQLFAISMMAVAISW